MRESKLTPAAQAEIEAVYRALPLETAGEFEDLTLDMRRLGILPTGGDFHEQVGYVRHFHNVCAMRDPATWCPVLSRRCAAHNKGFQFRKQEATT